LGCGSACRAGKGSSSRTRRRAGTGSAVLDERSFRGASLVALETAGFTVSTDHAARDSKFTYKRMGDYLLYGDFLVLRRGR
jgi:hypothetical protein